MLYPLNFEQYVSDELDEIVVREPLPNERSRLLLATVGAILIHVVILGFWKIDHSRVDLLPALKVSLLPSVEKPSPVPELVPTSKRETVREPVKDIQGTLPRISPVASSTEKDKPTGFYLYNKAIESVRQGTLPQETQYKTFSTRDFPQAQEKDRFESRQTIPVMVSQAESMERRDQSGYYTIKRTNGFGKSVCYQQRGFAGDGNPPMWYRVPASTCGHIK
jgi:hypothetical protein